MKSWKVADRQSVTLFSQNSTVKSDSLDWGNGVCLICRELRLVYTYDASTNISALVLALTRGLCLRLCLRSTCKGEGLQARVHLSHLQLVMSWSSKENRAATASLVGALRSRSCWTAFLFAFYNLNNSQPSIKTTRENRIGQQGLFKAKFHSTIRTMKYSFKTTQAQIASHFFLQLITSTFSDSRWWLQGAICTILSCTKMFTCDVSTFAAVFWRLKRSPETCNGSVKKPVLRGTLGIDEALHIFVW